ncbi:MAG: class I SAM-dependent methyltransferase [Cyanobacteria bacterium CRU_2_1]|nr:class I SAM-dependent methyltransferase [Cyanobacteria bacterium RU_5_0]NJR59595.1 class I SAM-dependent methyltransferase [Cyanobacteria bacterium CRU_2_1]
MSLSRQPIDLPASHPVLCQIVAQRINQSPDRRIPFAEFMELALYHPQHGYYATNQTGKGIQSDFFTSSHLGSDFGELLAEQFAQLWELLDRPHPFTLIEMGAGQGLIVQDVLRYLHRHHFSVFEALNYIIIETSPALIAEQQHRFQKLIQSWGQLHWRSWDEIPKNSIIGCCFSNELIDAFPVHQIAIEHGKLREIYVTLARGQENQGTEKHSSSFFLPPLSFSEVIDKLSTPKLAEYFDLINIQCPSERYPEGYRTEVNLAALDWLTTIADRLQKGYLLTIDYGYPAHRYYSPTRNQGTLQCYYQHAYHADPYVAIGYQDITAHVNFTALEQHGKQCGLETIGFTQQGLFLMALGLGDRLASLSQPDPDTPLHDLLQRREALHALINPMGLGNFGVLIQSKGVDNQSLRGLNVPPLV